MIKLFKCRTGSVAVETAIFTPVFLMMMLGITDIGGGMFVRMEVNAAAQAGATYVVLNSGTTGVQQAMNDASGISSLCTVAGVTCDAAISTPCADGTPNSKCVTVTTTYPYKPILADAVYTWALMKNVSTTITLRIQ